MHHLGVAGQCAHGHYSPLRLQRPARKVPVEADRALEHALHALYVVHLATAHTEQRRRGVRAACRWRARVCVLADMLRARDRQRQRKRERERETETERHTQRETEREKERVRCVREKTQVC